MHAHVFEIEKMQFVGLRKYIYYTYCIEYTFYTNSTHTLTVGTIAVYHGRKITTQQQQLTVGKAAIVIIWKSPFFSLMVSR